jgi:uncharacterized protein
VRLYIDSNAFVSQYTNDNPQHAVLTKQAIAQASTTASSPITYPEVRAAFRALRQQKRITQAQYLRAVTDFERDWPTVKTFEVNHALALLAGAIADQHLIRGCDAVHVATAVTFQAMTNDCQFLTFDQQLEKRVVASKLLVLWTP